MSPATAKGGLRIAPLVFSNLQEFKSLVGSIELAQESKPDAGSHLARFKLWSYSLGAHRSTGNQALEYRLKDASSIKNQILSLLQDLFTAICEAQASTLGQFDQTHDSSAYDEIEAYFHMGDGPTQSPLDRSLAEIGHILDCLLRLSATISNPAPHDQFQSRAGARLSELFEPYDIRHVQEKFKDIDSSIAERLGRAITMRRHYFRYRKEHHDKLSRGLEDSNDTGEVRTTIASSIPEQSKDAPGITSLLDDLYLDTQSEFSVTSYARSSAEQVQLQVLPMPKEHMGGQFLCPFCQMMIEVNTRRDWKKHVFRDLRPYVCVEKSCPTSSRQYARRSEWISHVKQEHWTTWSCSFGCSMDFPTSDIWREHNSSAHGQEITDSELMILETSSIQHDLSKAIGTCPLCIDFQIKDSKHYSSHIGHHLESIALFSLPQMEGNDGTSEEEEVETAPDNNEMGGWMEQSVSPSHDFGSPLVAIRPKLPRSPRILSHDFESRQDLTSTEQSIGVFGKDAGSRRRFQWKGDLSKASNQIGKPSHK